MRINNLTIYAADIDGIATTQTPAGAGAVIISGVLTSVNPKSGLREWIADVPRVLGITSAGNDSGIVFTITGENKLGQLVSEIITGANVGVATSIGIFKKIISIEVSGATAGNITIGTTEEVTTPWQPMNLHVSPFEVGVIIEANDTPTVTFTLQHTMDDVQDLTVTPTAINDGVIAGQTATNRGVIKEISRAIRLEMTSFTAGTIQFGYVQAGIAN